MKVLGTLITHAQSLRDMICLESGEHSVALMRSWTYGVLSIRSALWEPGKLNMRFGISTVSSAKVRLDASSMANQELLMVNRTLGFTTRSMRTSDALPGLVQPHSTGLEVKFENNQRRLNFTIWEVFRHQSLDKRSVDEFVFGKIWTPRVSRKRYNWNHYSHFSSRTSPDLWHNTHLAASRIRSGHISFQDVNTHVIRSQWSHWLANGLIRTKMFNLHQRLYHVTVGKGGKISLGQADYDVTGLGVSTDWLKLRSRPHVLRWRNFKTESVSSVFGPHYSWGIPKAQQSSRWIGHFWFVFDQNSLREITWLSWGHRFRKGLFSKCFQSTRKRKDGVFKILWFEERFWKLLFSWHISVDGRSNSRNKAAF